MLTVNRISPSPPQHLASKSSIRFFDIYKLASKEKMEKERARLADELNRIARENKILIPRIAARKFPAMDVIYSNGRKSKLSIIFDASGVDVSKLAVPEASLVCLSFRANSQVCKPFYDVLSKSSDGANNALQRHIVFSFGDHYYFRKELKILNLLTGFVSDLSYVPINILLIFLADTFGLRGINWQFQGNLNCQILSLLGLYHLLKKEK
ncbi:hypothetical protein ERO13_A11G191650v2 [Gossypium hirsutum]|nr:hypothetical protein ERO13_A11G191650v2 [Gossypium hirsutum]